MGSDEIWKIPVDGGPESLVLKDPNVQGFANWALASTGIYFIAEKAEQKEVLTFYDFFGKRFKEILRFEKDASFPAISPDGKFLIYTQLDQSDSTIMLVNHFH